MANYLVTGGAGFIGSNIVEFLLAQGDSVRVLDNFATGKRENLAPFLDRIEIVEGDLRSDEVCRRAVADIDYVLHQGAMASVPRSIAEPVETIEINVLGTIRLLTAAAKAGVRRLVYAASSSAYGDQPVPEKVETLLPMPLSPYAAAKLAGEYFCQAFSRSMGLEAVGLRYFNVFGPRQDPHSQYSAVIPLFVTAILEDRPPTIHGDGSQTRDFTFVENNVRANILAATTSKPVAGRVINIHPSLLPAFGGKGFHGAHVHRAVLDRGCTISGCTVHLVDQVYDHGRILLQRAVPVLPDDTPDSLAARVFAAECEALPEVIARFATNPVS